MKHEAVALTGKAPGNAPRSHRADATYDALVIGAGFGGLGAALALAEAGASVCVCESLRYPGGCASTFTRGGARFDAGATLVSGLAKGQLFGDWLARYSPSTVVDWMDPLVELRTRDFSLSITRDRESLVHSFLAIPGAPARAIRDFFDFQRKIAASLWELFDDPTLLPPFGLETIARHAGRALRYLPLLPLLGTSLGEVLASHGLADFRPLRTYVDALCQITVQCSADEAEATFALAAMDYYYRGTGHVRGGVGALASALVSACEQAGTEVLLSNRVTALRREADGSWLATTRRGEVRARAIVANLLPSALASMLEPERHARAIVELRSRSAPIEKAWGAAMLYAVARPPEGEPDDAHHLELVNDASAPFSEGNHVFVSISSALETERAPKGRRVLTMSTHVPLAKLARLGEGTSVYVAEVQDAMRATVAARAPEWHAGLERVITASPRTFARFVGRPAGAVGGLPRRVGLASYTSLGPSSPLDDVWLVGDSVFPGQSALATAIGGVRTATAITRRLGSFRAAALPPTEADAPAPEAETGGG